MSQFSTIISRAIVLSSSDFRESHKIVTLYSESEGIIKFFATLSKKRRPEVQALLTPFTTIEASISKKRNSDFYRFHEGILLNQRIELRKELMYLQTAQQLVSFLSTTQWPGEGSSSLFYLLDHFLSLISLSPQPGILPSLFIIKLLKHEGILQMETRCAHCQSNLSILYRYKGERYCKEHAPPPSLSFLPEEEEWIQRIFVSRESNQLTLLPLSEIFIKKIVQIFKQNYSLHLGVIPMNPAEKK